MKIASVFYAAFGYWALFAAILWGMLFVAGGVRFPNMDGDGTAVPLAAAFVDLGLLLLLALLHQSVSRGMLRHVERWPIPRGLERGTQAWAAAIVLAAIYAGWQPLPRILWTAPEPLEWALAALYYVAWTLILIGVFLGSHLEGMTAPVAADDGESSGTTAKMPLLSTLTGTLGEPLYAGVLLAVWAVPVMSVGHFVLAAAVTAYLVLDRLWTMRKTAGAPETRRIVSFQGQGVAR